MGNISIKIIGCWLVVFFMLAVTAQAAASYLLSDMNSTVEIDPNSSDGVWRWTVDGSDHMYQQWFWYRIGAVDPEMSIDTLSAPQVSLVGADFDPGNEILNLRYADSDLQIDVSFVLSGGPTGSNLSDIAEQITITNISDSTLDFHFFQYVDFDLTDNGFDDTAWLINPNTVRQSGPDWTVSETVVTPAPDHWEIDTFPNTRNLLNDDTATTFSDTTSPLGPGNVTWAFQWDKTITAGGAFQISKDKQMRIPEPATLGLLLGGLALLKGFRRIKKERPHAR